MDFGTLGEQTMRIFATLSPQLQVKIFFSKIILSVRALTIQLFSRQEDWKHLRTFRLNWRTYFRAYLFVFVRVVRVVRRKPIMAGGTESAAFSSYCSCSYHYCIYSYLVYSRAYRTRAEAYWGVVGVVFIFIIPKFPFAFNFFFCFCRPGQCQTFLFFQSHFF